MGRYRTHYPISDGIAVEMLSAVLVNLGPELRRFGVRAQARELAASILTGLREHRAGLLQHPTVVSLDAGPIADPGRISSTRALRAACSHAWQDAWLRRRDPVEAFEAALRAAIELQPQWTLEDAALHTIRFVLPERYRRLS